MTCPACDIAESRPRTGHYTAGCLECTARGLAQDPAAHKAAGGDPADLQEAIRKLFPDFREGRVLVWKWIQRFEARENTVA